MSKWHAEFFVIPVKYCRIFAGVLLGLFLLSSCHTGATFRRPVSPILPYKVKGASDAEVIVFQRYFTKNHIQVLTMGQNYLISIPAGYLFANQSPHLLPDSYALLNQVACFLRLFRKIDIHVTAFSNKCVSPQREHTLTLARAKKVADYMWTQNVDARFIFSQGLGSEKPIICNRGVAALLAFHQHNEPVKPEDIVVEEEVGSVNIFTPLRYPKNAPPILVKDVEAFSKPLISINECRDYLMNIERLVGENDKIAGNIANELINDFQVATTYPSEERDQISYQDLIAMTDALSVAIIDEREKAKNKEES